MIVFGVCALGVGCLYLAPSLARTPDQVALPVPKGGRTAGSVPDPGAPPSQPAATVDTGDGVQSEGGADLRGDGPSPSPTVPTASTGQTVRTSGTQAATKSGSAHDTRAKTDDEPPTPVTKITPAKLTHATLTLSWPPAKDDTGVVGYRIWLSGFEVATTVETHATVPWFNDDDGEHVVQVRALDAAGNESTSSPNLVVVRPGAGPEPTPTDTPSPSPSATPTTDVATTAPEATPAPEPGGEATSEAPQAQSTVNEAETQ